MSNSEQCFIGTKKRGIVQLSILHTEALPTAYQSRTDNVRAHADMIIATVKRPISNNGLCPKGYNLCLQGLHGIDIITPGTSTVDYIRDFDTESFGRFQCVSNTASINAFYMS